MKQSIILILLFVLINTAAAVDLISSGELVEKSNFYNGKTILFRGEVIGEVMVREEGAWLNINDDAYCQGSSKLMGYNSGQSIWAKAEDVKIIKTCGDYFHTGDVVEITGVFNRACKKHGGDMDIHAQTVTLIQPGKKIEHSIKPWKILASIILFFLIVILSLINYNFRKRG